VEAGIENQPARTVRPLDVTGEMVLEGRERQRSVHRRQEDQTRPRDWLSRPRNPLRPLAPVSAELVESFR
jgi:hypothetical protein